MMKMSERENSAENSDMAELSSCFRAAAFRNRQRVNEKLRMDLVLPKVAGPFLRVEVILLVGGVL